MFKIGIFTTTRAEFGILSPVIELLNKSDYFDVKLFVGGAHLAEEYGKTISEIYSVGIEPTDTFDYLLNENTSSSLSKSLGIATIELSHIFSKHDFDYVCVLGDRYELLSIISNAILFNKPIIHIGGGEATEGLIDEQIRHMITKASHIHFTTTDEYRQKIINMGESRWRVHTSGAPTIDAIKLMKKKSKNEIFTELGLDANQPTALLTYHPVTLEFDVPVKDQIKNIFTALEKFDLQLLTTSPNIEVDRDEIITIIKNETLLNENYFFIESLGFKKYHNFLPHCILMIGNSSSGILEAPYYKIPTINIGRRQDGRMRHTSVIDTDYTSKSIANGIKEALSPSMKKKTETMQYKFGDGSAGQIIHDVLLKELKNKSLMHKQLIFAN
jgi:GDP/UDP-N,N'-diacetylbacillosamine 2-epimerase (hydrolysing)